MPYNYPYPAYQPAMQQYQQPMPVVQPQIPPVPYPNGNGIIWVKGEEEANRYLVQPGTTVSLWDSEAPVIYLKTVGINNVVNIRVLDYTVRENANQQQEIKSENPEYVTKSDLAEFEERMIQQIQSIRYNGNRRYNNYNKESKENKEDE